MDSATRLVNLLVIDDNIDRHAGIAALLHGRANLLLRTPDDVTEEDLVGADLVSVDEYLGHEWKDLVESQSTLALRNLDGLSVAAAFRSQERTYDSYFAVTLHTGDLAGLSAGLPEHPREALTAAQHDLDWVFAWAVEGLGARWVELAEAAHSVSSAAVHMSNDLGAHWLEMPEQPWTEIAVRQLEDCRPPAHGLASNTRGRSYLRWLAQRVLPYPSFLLDATHAANLLGVTVESFHRLDAANGVPASAKYSGPLKSFMGRRWWRAALQHLLEDADVPYWEDAPRKATALARHTGVDLTPLEAPQGIVTQNLAGHVTAIGVAPDNAVRLHRDGWPVFADDPWALLSDADADSELARLVLADDLHRLHTYSGTQR